MVLLEHKELQDLAILPPRELEVELGTERLLPTKEVCLVGWREPFWVVALMERMERMEPMELMELATPAMHMATTMLAMGLAPGLAPESSLTIL